MYCTEVGFNYPAGGRANRRGSGLRDGRARIGVTTSALQQGHPTEPPFPQCAQALGVQGIGLDTNAGGSGLDTNAAEHCLGPSAAEHCPWLGSGTMADDDADGFPDGRQYRLMSVDVYGSTVRKTFEPGKTVDRIYRYNTITAGRSTSRRPAQSFWTS